MKFGPHEYFLLYGNLYSQVNGTLGAQTPLQYMHSCTLCCWERSRMLCVLFLKLFNCQLQLQVQVTVAEIGVVTALDN